MCLSYDVIMIWNIHDTHGLQKALMAGPLASRFQICVEIWANSPETDIVPLHTTICNVESNVTLNANEEYSLKQYVMNHCEPIPTHPLGKRTDFRLVNYIEGCFSPLKLDMDITDSVLYTWFASCTAIAGESLQVIHRKWISNYIRYKVWVKLLIHSKVATLKFGNG